MSAALEELEAESERRRQRIAALLRDTGPKITAAALVDQGLAVARTSGRSTVDTMGRLAVRHPIPSALIGAGVAFLLVGKARGAKIVRTPAPPSRHVANRRDALAADARRKMNGGLSRIRRLAGAAADAMSDMQRTGAESLRSLSNTMEDRMRRSATDIPRGLEEPIVLAALGVALGAALGAAFRSTEYESRVMGGASREMKEKAREFAEEQVDHVKDAVNDAGAAVRDTVESAVQDVSGHAVGTLRAEHERQARPARSEPKPSGDGIDR
jgi:hypothetical protein